MPGTHRPSRPPVVLIANDQDWASRSLESVLGPRGYAVLRASTTADALKLGRVAHPDAYILHAGMPDRGGVELCARLRSDPKFPLNVPIIITTSAVASRSERLSAYAAGAWELCSEPLDTEVLLHKLDSYVQAKLAADRVRDESLVDDETGLYNARGLARRAREIGSEAVRRAAGLACVAFAPEPEFADTADEDDRELAELVRDICRTQARASDAVGRIGPNEYVIIASSNGERGAEQIVTRLSEAFASTILVSRGRQHRLRLHAKIAAVTNLAEAPTDAVDMLYNATTSLREFRTNLAVSTAAGASAT
jgi:PleD family two-component response regulator